MAQLIEKKTQAQANNSSLQVGRRGKISGAEMTEDLTESGDKSR